jgi:phosphoglycolate phosphatase
MNGGMTRPTTVLFDLDGTISDSASGILAALEVAFDDHGIPWLDHDDAMSLIGPPFRVALAPFVGELRVPSVIAAYRKHYVDGGGMFNTTMYDGIDTVIATLHAHGITLAVATSKGEPSAVEIVRHFGLSGYFTTVGGDTPEGARGTKALVVTEVLARLGNPDPATVMMVGDRHHDVEGARANGLACIGALWGYGTLDELRHAGAAAVCADPGELLDALGITARV